MNWEMLAAVGQLAAVLVGIPSLIYRPPKSERKPGNDAVGCERSNGTVGRADNDGFDCLSWDAPVLGNA